MHPEEQSPAGYRSMIVALLEGLQDSETAEITILKIAKQRQFRTEWLQKPKKVKKRSLGTSVDPTL